MNMKKIIRKVAAVGAGLTMVGATLMGAVATNLNEYPSPFVQDGVFDAVLIVGDTAAPIDIVGITDIAMALQFSMGVEEVVETGEGITSVEDGVIEDDNPLGESLGDLEYDDGDITILTDDSVRYNGEDYDYEEMIVIDDNALIPVSAEANDDFKTNPAIIVNSSEDICYVYEFDTAVPFTADKDLNINFAGMDLRISGAPDDKELTLTTSTEKWMNYGDKLEVTIKDIDYTIELGNVYNDEALIIVNGITEVMEIGDEEDFGFDDFELEVLNVLNDDGTDNDAVKISYGATVSETAEDTQAAEMLGYGDDNDEAEWVWSIKSTKNTSVKSIGVCYNQDRDEIEDELDEDWELPALFEGDSIMFPNDFATIEFAATRNDDSYEQVSIEYDDSLTFTSDNSEDNGTSNNAVWKINSAEEIIVYDGEEYETVYILNNKSDVNSSDICMEDANGNKDCEESFMESKLSIKVDDEELYLVFNYTPDIVETITLQNIVYTPTLDGEAGDAGELKVNSENISSIDEDFMTNYGIIVETPEDNLESGDYGRVVLQIPDEAVTVDIAVSAQSATTTSTDTTQIVTEQIEVGATKLASEIADITAQNAIVVGGPAVNMAAAELLGNPSQEEILTMFTPGKAMVKLFENGDNVAMLIAGYDGEDTRTACKIVANGAITEIDGMEGEVITTSESVTAPVVVEE